MKVVVLILFILSIHSMPQCAQNCAPVRNCEKVGCRVCMNDCERIMIGQAVPKKFYDYFEEAFKKLKCKRDKCTCYDVIEATTLSDDIKSNIVEWLEARIEKRCAPKEDEVKEDE